MVDICSYQYLNVHTITQNKIQLFMKISLEDPISQVTPQTGSGKLTFYLDQQDRIDFKYLYTQHLRLAGVDISMSEFFSTHILRPWLQDARTSGKLIG